MEEEILAKPQSLPEYRNALFKEGHVFSVPLFEQKTLTYHGYNDKTPIVITTTYSDLKAYVTVKLPI